MALSDYDDLTTDIALPGGKSFSVRGISLVDITSLVRSRGAEIQAFFVQYSRDNNISKAGREGGDLTLSPEMGMQLLDAAPMLVAEIITCAADEPKMIAIASRLPITVQLEALEAIASLTFDAAGGPKKFGEAVMRILQGTNGLMSDLSQSKIGSLASAGK